MQIDPKIITYQSSFEVYIPGKEPFLFLNKSCFLELGSVFYDKLISPQTTIKIIIPENRRWASQEEVQQFLNEINNLKIFPEVTFDPDDFTIQFVTELYCDNYRYYLMLLSLIRYLYEAPFAYALDIFFNLKKEYNYIRFLDLLFYSCCIYYLNNEDLNIFRGHNIYCSGYNYQTKTMHSTIIKVDSKKTILFDDEFLSNISNNVKQGIQSSMRLQIVPFDLALLNKQNTIKEKLTQINEEHKKI